jgi:hypothetical protein
MMKVLTDRTLPLAVAQVLVRIDGIESGIAASIDRFADTVGRGTLQRNRTQIRHS